MLKRILVSIFLITAAAGCATTEQGQENKALQDSNRANYLEKELQKKDQMIKSLQDELDKKNNSGVVMESATPADEKNAAAPKISKKDIQKALKVAGFYKGPIDGKMGAKSKEAVKEFQKANNLRADGFVGEKTKALLVKYLNQ